MKRILLVDDEAKVTETLAPVLREGLAAEVETAASATEALALLRRRPAFDLVVADYVLDGQGRGDGRSGLDLLREVGQEFPRAARVLMTEQRRAVLAAGAPDDVAGLDALVTKPYSLVRLQKTLGIVLAGRRVRIPPADGEG